MAFAIRESRYISGDTKRKYALLLILRKGLPSSHALRGSQMGLG
ncbi:hypothetical protein [Bacterioplanoides sp.]